MELFVAGFLLSLSVCLDLGIVNVAVVRAGFQHGARPAFLIGFGACFGDLIYAGLSATVFSFVLDISAIRYTLWIGGTIMLLYLAYQMLKEALNREADQEELVLSAAEAPCDFKQFVQGFGLSIASPSSLLWFASVGGSVIASYAHADFVDRTSAILFFAGFFFAGFAWSIGLALMSGQGQKLMGDRAMQGLSAVSGLLFLYFAGHVFWDGYQAFGGDILAHASDWAELPKAYLERGFDRYFS